VLQHQPSCLKRASCDRNAALPVPASLYRQVSGLPLPKRQAGNVSASNKAASEPGKTVERCSVQRPYPKHSAAKVRGPQIRKRPAPRTHSASGLANVSAAGKTLGRCNVQSPFPKRSAR
jgi:hypothetical protein